MDNIINKNIDVDNEIDKCWFCRKSHYPMYFSWEFDTPVHVECLKLALQDKNDDEAIIIMDELKDLLTETDNGIN